METPLSYKVLSQQTAAFRNTAGISRENRASGFRRLARQTLTFYSKRTLTSIGVPEAGVEFMGVAVGLAMIDAKFHLNTSRTVALELKDVADKDRALFLGIKMDW